MKLFKSIIIRIHWVYKRIFFRIISIYRIIFLLYLPNLEKILKNNVLNLKYLAPPHQKVLFTGQGKISFKGTCKLGYKLGGFNRCGSIEIQPRYFNSSIIFGENVSTNNNIFICAANFIQIGKNTRIGQNVTIMDFEAHGINPNKRNKVGEIGKVIIEENVWIGNNVVILKNSIIGKNSIIAAGAVLSGRFPENVIIGGIPARIIKNISIE